MSSAALVFVALALLCAALRVLLWQRGTQRKGQASAERYIDSRMAPAAPAVAAGGMTGGRTRGWQPRRAGHRHARATAGSPAAA